MILAGDVGGTKTALALFERRDPALVVAREAVLPSRECPTFEDVVDIVGRESVRHRDDELTRAMPSREGVVEVVLRNGTKLRRHVKAVRGTAENPMSRAEVDAKAYDLIVPVFGKSRARRLCDAIWSLDRLPNARKLRPLLQKEEK